MKPSSPNNPPPINVASRSLKCTSPYFRHVLTIFFLFFVRCFQATSQHPVQVFLKNVTSPRHLLPISTFLTPSLSLKPHFPHLNHSTSLTRTQYTHYLSINYCQSQNAFTYCSLLFFSFFLPYFPLFSHSEQLSLVLVEPPTLNCDALFTFDAARSPT